MMGRSSAAVKKIIRSIDPNLRWFLAQQELKRCISDEKSIVHSVFKLNTLVQKPNENVCMYIINIMFLFMATGLTDNCTTSTLFHNQFIQFFTIFQQFNISIVQQFNNITVSASIIIIIIMTITQN